MNNLNLQNLIDEFDELNKWETEFSSTESRLDIDKFIQSCLSIISLLSSHNNSIDSIAKNFLLIPNKTLEKNIDNQLKNDFKLIDCDLSEDLRGFSNLLDFVLSESTIKIDYEQALDNLPARHQKLVEPFKIFLGALDAYSDIEYAFFLNDSKVILLLFFLLIKELVTKMTKKDGGCSHDSLKQWLKNKPMFDKLELAFDLEQLANYCFSQGSSAKTMLISFICLMAAKNNRFSIVELQLLDKLLLALGLMGINVFLESGFILREDHNAKIFSIA